MNRVVLITGVSHGIGQATARLFRSRGWNVVGVDRSEGEGADELSLFIEADLSRPEAAAEVKGAFEVKYGGLDALVNNPAVQVCRTIEETSLEDWDRLIRTDLTSVFYACKAAIPPMLERDYGRIVVVSSIAGLEGAPNNSAYSAAKAGAIGYAKAVGKELAKSNVMVNSVAPSGIDTPMLEDVKGPYMDFVLSKMPIGRLGRAEETASLICWLASEENSFSSGAVFDSSGGRAVY